MFPHKSLFALTLGVASIAGAHLLGPTAPESITA